MITGQPIGLLFALVYRQIRKTMAAFQGPQRLPIMTFEVGKAACTQTVAISELKPQCGFILEKPSALQRNTDRLGDQNGQSGVWTWIVLSCVYFGICDK